MLTLQNLIAIGVLEGVEAISTLKVTISLVHEFKIVIFDKH
jgi:hypothetical protein